MLPLCSIAQKQSQQYSSIIDEALQLTRENIYDLRLLEDPRWDAFVLAVRDIQANDDADRSDSFFFLME